MKIVKLRREDLFREVKKKIITTDIVLDIGCGINPEQMIIPAVHICYEPFQEYIDYLQNKIRGQFDRVYLVLKGTWKDAIETFPDKSVDTVFLIDVIEHLDKEEALDLLKQMEKIARVQIIIFTPLGFMPQHHSDGKDAWGMNGGSWQEHRSGWLPEDFDDTWEFFISEDFHTHDNLGKKFNKPQGAIWAVKTIGTFRKRNLVKIVSKKMYLWLKKSLVI
ncbi:MAG: class I SAM-dependent methyltransferase [Candidatus Vogelbacteria bacterium]|nr:class I SAM-dependent methyltransferase [Candidatus Vogelbacteria bacterium]